MMRSALLTTVVAATDFPHPHLPKVRVPVWADIDFFEAFSDSLLNDQSDELMCILGALSPVGDAASVMEDKGNRTAQFDDLSLMFHDIPVAIDGCSPVSDDVKAALMVLHDIHGVKDLLHVMTTNFKGNDDDILDEIEAALDNFNKTGQSTEFGTAVGSAIHHLIIGKYPDEATIV